MRANPLSILKKRPTLFRTLTGLPLDKFTELLKEIKPLYEQAETKRLNRENRKRKQGGGRQKQLDLSNQLVMLLMYYRLYVSQEFLGLIFSLHNCNVSRQINYLEPLLSKVFKIPTRKIKLEEENLSEQELLEIFIDATEQQIRRPKRKQKRYYSGKKKKHTIKNQLVVTGKGKILSVSRSNPGSKHDKKLYDETKLNYDKQAKPISDSGYFGAAGITMPIKKPKGKELTAEEKKFNRELSKQRIIVEHTIGKMKIFQILSQRYRNDLSKHSLVFKNVAGLYNLLYS
jgi:transposase